MNKERLCYMDKIVVGNNVMIGAVTIILARVTIGDNVIIVADNIVSKDIPSRTVVDCIPAMIIGSFDDLAETSSKQCQGNQCHLSCEEEIKDFSGGKK